MNPTYSETDPSDSLKDQVAPYLNKWPWFLISVMAFLLMGYGYLRYTTDTYKASAKILIKDTQGGGGGLSELSAFSDLDVLGNSFNTVENEMEILKSNKLIDQVVENLDLHIVYTKTGNIKSTDVYKNSSLKLTLLDAAAGYTLPKSVNLVLRPSGDQSFQIKLQDTDDFVTYSYGSEFIMGDLSLLVVPNKASVSNLALEKPTEEKPWEELVISIHPIIRTTKAIQSDLDIVKIDKRGSVLELSFVDANREKATDVLNNLILVYNEDAVKDKNEVARNTSQFIEERLRDIQKDLDSVERGIQKFKTSENLTDLVTEAELNLEFSAGIGREVIETETQLKIALLLKDKFKGDVFALIPENIGLKDVNFEQSAAKYNVLVQEYLRYKENSTPKNPVLQRLGYDITSLREAILVSLNNVISSMSIQKESLTKELNRVSGKISDIPENERVNRDIERDRIVVEAVYLLLNQKKETTAISLAVTASKAKIVDYPLAPIVPISPKPRIVYLAMCILGLLVPGVFIYGVSIFYNKIVSRKDIEKYLPNINILGEVPKLDKDSNDYIQLNDRSVLAESFRILRTNLQYKLNAVSHDHTKVVLVTSTVKGEGKTMVAVNLANTFSYSGKNVLLIGGDIRNPQLHRYFDKVSKRTRGVTDFLTDNHLKLKDLIIASSTNQSLDILLSGPIPPNPAELWMQDRTKTLFEEAKDLYDLVIVDSAPTILVTDTLLINKYADVTAYVTRANYTDTSLLQFVSDAVKDGKLKNVAVIVNNVKLANFGYGNKYGYAYGEEKRTLWSTFKSRFQKKRTLE
jgi:tyrosine-protein kinase Etk/Wzc